MTTTAAARSVVVERDLAHAPDRIWRALTQPHLMEQWLMKTDFSPKLGQAFTLTGEWGSVDCKVLEIEPLKSLSYSWDAMGVESVVTFTLVATPEGARLRLEQSGFRPDQDQAFQGAQYGWAKMFGDLEALLAKLD